MREVEVGESTVPRYKFIIPVVIIIGVMIYLIATSSQANAQYFLTIDELKGKGEAITGQTVRLSGAVVGDTIQYEPDRMTLTFTIANIPGDNKDIDAQGGLAKVLHDAVQDPKRTRIKVVHTGPKPDLLRNEAQAILVGHLEEDGTFFAYEIMLKCPTRYKEAVPDQVK
jgi:cytochrome c-type biogenesis protein CcmE